MDSDKFVVATVKPWNAAEFRRRMGGDERWRLVEGRDALTAEALAEIGPRYVFFPHWSWTIPADVHERFECILFHMTDLPYGRGGSPLQNLIARGHKTTKVSALRVSPEIDAGPIYMKRDLSLEGSATEIFARLAATVFDMIEAIASDRPAARPQTGEAVYFVRRTPEQSALPAGGTPEGLYDHVRMLDAETYPPAFVDWGDWRIELRGARRAGDGVEAVALIRARLQGPAR